MANREQKRAAYLDLVASVVFHNDLRIPVVRIPQRPFGGVSMGARVPIDDVRFRPGNMNCRCVPRETVLIGDAAQCATCGGWSTDIEDGRCFECRSLPGEVQNG
jgi:hypothetical protein